MTVHASSIDSLFRSLNSTSERQYGRGALHLAADSRKITEALATDLIASGIDPAAIKVGEVATESAGYRLRAHRWDLVIIKDGVPAAVVEWKTISHPANFDNRLDELVAAAANLRMPFDRTAASDYRPLLAVLFIVNPRPVAPTLGPSLEMFADRLCKMVNDQLLDCACVLYLDPHDEGLVNFNNDLAFDQFASVIASRIRSKESMHASEPDSAIDLGRLLSVGDVAGVVTGLASTTAGLSAVEAASIAARRRVVADLQALAVADDTTETLIHREIAGNYWIFGGQYVGIAPRRDFGLLDQHDYPLLCADGSIHVVELKGPSCALVRKYRNHYIVTTDVHEATSQCLNYLRSLDEQGPTLETTYRNELGIDIDFRRARGTVVIGHLGRSETSTATKSQIEQTIRSYNAHLSRIQVLTYSDLLDSADRALRFEAFAQDELAPG